MQLGARVPKCKFRALSFAHKCKTGNARKTLTSSSKMTHARLLRSTSESGMIADSVTRGWMEGEVLPRSLLMNQDEACLVVPDLRA